MLIEFFFALTTYIRLHFKQVFLFHTESSPILQPPLSQTALYSSGGTVCETTWNSCHTGSVGVQKNNRKHNKLFHHFISDDYID